jgi:hypothetical protein
MDKDLEKARKDLDDEFMHVRHNLDKVREQLDKVSAAGPEDDLSAMLDELEDIVKKVRTGGLLGAGAKAHHRAREKYFELKGTAT